MSRDQRGKHDRRVALDERLRELSHTSLELPAAVVAALLGELCVQLGWCLAPRDHDALVAEPPQTPRAFAEAVVNLDGGGVDDPDLFLPVLDLVLRTFQGRVDARRGARRVEEESKAARVCLPPLTDP